MLKQVPINELIPGMMVTRVIEQHGPVKIRRVGLIKSSAMVKGLTEMGVSLLEVDESQSVVLDSPESQVDVAEQGRPSLTPTQRLMEKDKQSAAVDRQLSQQFHRSLFMPALDEMPSKWRLYFRPYAVLFGFIVTGFALGFLAISIAINLSSWLSGESTAVAQAPANSAEQSGAAEEQVAQMPPNDLRSESSVSVQNQFRQSTTPPTDELADELTEQLTDAGQNFEQEPVKSFQTLNGIVLNEGETVVGYGAAEDQDTEQDSSSVVNTDAPSTSSLSADLLSRVNRAAAQLEAEQVDAEQDLVNEDVLKPLNIDEFLRNDPIGPVMDLRVPKADKAEQTGRVVRIDQLPPAILTQIPSMSFSAHMYASNPQDRWVRVNGRRLSEGDFIDDSLSIVEIESERIILAFKGETFTMNALSDW